MNPTKTSTAPKRILALDGGGVRGIISIAFLERMEAELRAQPGKSDLVLADHFDLIGGTSVGSIIATMLVLGWPMEKIHKTFTDWCPDIFGKPRWLGLVRTKFRARALTRHLSAVLGDMRLDDPALRTGYAIVTKRLDTGSPWWIVSNNPSSRWWNGPEADQRNHAFQVADLVRASTAAPTVFTPKRLPIAPGGPYGTFVDGGISPFNNPALALLMVARLKGHGLEWPLGADRLQLVSVGTGTWREPVRYGFWSRQVAALLAVQALRGMINDMQSLSLAMLQWMSTPRLAWPINSEIGSLAGEVLGAGSGPHAPLLKFQRYDLELQPATLAPLMADGKSPTRHQLSRLRSLDDPGELQTLYQLAQKAAKMQVRIEDFL